MHAHALDSRQGLPSEYLIGRGQAWFAFAMTIGLMLVDYIDRQVVVSLFPYMKTDWGLSDKELGALVSVVSVTVALGALPVALIADRYSRVKSIVVMATIWSLATISCMATRNYAQLLTARSFVGMGEAGYGSVGAALIASIFPARMRSALLAGFFAAASVGSVLGVMLGGLIAAKWGWKTAFGVVGFPGLLLALMYLKVRDYRTVDLTPELNQATKSTGSTASFIVKALVRSPTMLWVCLGGASQLIVVSAVWSWMPSFLNRYHDIPPDQAAIKAALVVLAGAAGSVVWGSVVDRTAVKRPRNKLVTMAALCVLALLVLMPTMAATGSAALTPSTQFALIALGGFLMTCTVGPVSAVVTDVVHPGVRATGLSVLALFQNLFGLAAGPFLTGVLSDALGLQTALTLIPGFSLLAAFFFMCAARTYERDMEQVKSVAVVVPGAEPAPAGAR